MQYAHDLINTLHNQATNPKLETRYSSCLENYNDDIDDLRGLPALSKYKDYIGLNIYACAALDDAYV
ncbi:hypothetical protein MTR67_052299 [Solanum verrucosum]|uniref:Uncharacterized protein n=1 Tax=Solanum verrucosum TaxID=315347 RepID=A0AAF0V7R3_SOLVR|nr:hypothetical protein MTR67_052299 [Solanum verrucosum]